jgi:type IV secretory pathway VirB4 component
MMRDDLLREKVRQMEPLLGPRIRMLWYKYVQAKSLDKKLKWKRMIELMAETHIKTYEDEIRLPPPEKENTKGEYELGNVIYPDKEYSTFGIKENEWCKHILISGMTGAGKTNTVFKIISELKKKNKPFMVFDWSKEYKSLKKKHKDIIILRASDKLKFNPLIPPKGTDTKEWLTKLTDVINHAYLGGHGTEFMMRNVLDKAYKKAGVYEGKKVYPTFNIVKSYADSGSYKGRVDLWNQTLQRVLDSLTFAGGLGNVTLTNENTNIGELLKKCVIVEMDNLSENDKTFLTEALSLWIYEYRKNQGITSEFRHALIIEEAHNILSKKKERQKGGETIMETTLRTIRKYGEAVIIIDQEPSKISESMKANTYTKITFNLGNGRDIEDISRCTQLSREQQAYIDKLKIGQAIIKLKGRFTQPILVQFPHSKIEKPQEVTP